MPPVVPTEPPEPVTDPPVPPPMGSVPGGAECPQATTAATRNAEESGAEEVRNRCIIEWDSFEQSVSFQEDEALGLRS